MMAASKIALTLIVLKSSRPDALLRFYRAIGLTFDRERHGNGPEHHAAQLGDTVLEVYPSVDDAPNNTDGTRIGFEVTDLDAVVARLDDIGIQIVFRPRSTEWGVRAVAQGPDGRKVELFSRRPTQ